MQDKIKLAEERFVSKAWRFTSGARNVGKIIFTTKSPLSATEITEILAKKGLKSDLTTVYRLIDRYVALDLAHLNNGQVMPCSFPDNKNEEHHFLMCESCGEAEEITLNYKASISLQLDTEKKFKLRKVDLVFYGLCKSCRKKFD
jgi:Fur family ferric uptake transcriptional regulator